MVTLNVNDSFQSAPEGTTGTDLELPHSTQVNAIQQATQTTEEFHKPDLSLFFNNFLSVVGVSEDF